MGEAAALSHHPHPINMLPPTPAGLETLYNLCRKIYPDQANPLQVTALLKFWLGGPDPLDYISMYSNPGDPDENVPPHWHYISFGLSDLHGDGRVHDPSGPDGASGFGFELTFRLKREPGETSPPTWPATLMQSLAKYVFQSGNSLCASDHVSWHCALDNSESRIQHMLMTTDPQLNTTETPFGTVNFVQIVGICADELKATQQWNGSGILDILRRSPAAGGSWLITDMTRSDSIFELDPSTHEEVERGFELDGSNLSGVSGRCSWSEHDYFSEKSCKTSRSRLGSFHDAFLVSSLEAAEIARVRKLDGVHLILNLEAGSLLPLAIRGRVKHGRHFTFKSALEETAVTLVAHSVTGTLVNPESPYVSQGSWLQVLITDDLAQDMGVTFQALASPEALSLPKTFSWPERKLSITIVADKAALWDNTELLEDLLEGGQHAFLNSQDSWGRTPLHAAVISENSKCLQLLLNAGSDANVQCGPRGEYKTPLHVCAEYGHLNNIKTLLQHNANIQMKDGNGLTALNVAENCGKTKCAQLIKEAADAKEKARLDIHAAIGHACSQGDANSVQQLLSSLQNDAELIVNMAPSGANTLLFSACEAGNRQIAKILLDFGADGRCHSVTKYSPLYIASYQGQREVVEMLLIKFPELVQQHTVERWLPIHAACINGHYAVLELLFYFPYPTRVLRKYRDASEQWEYFMPFDINERDATGQNILYVASLLGNKKLIDVILNFKVKATRIIQSGSSEDDLTPLSESVVSPTRRRISDGIMSIMSKLHISKDCSADNEFDGNTKSVCPLRIDMYCNNNTETALHAGIRGRHYDITLALLNAGANANAIIKPYHNINEDVSACSVEDDLNYTSSGLVEACRNRDVPIVDLLLKRGARDDDCKALVIAVTNKDETLIAKLLSTKAHPDPEYKINKKSMTENINSTHITMFANISSLTYSSLFPNTPTMINWHNQKCGLSEIKLQWLIDAALNLNPKLKQNPRSYDIALFSVTRLDVSNNNISQIPLGVFQLQSLKYLNLSQNRIEQLPTPEVSPVKKGSKRRGRKENLSYCCPLLEELYLQENRLDQVPDAIFELPNLITLVISNNKLQHLPYNMWMAPKLKELNASFNLLKELPSAPNEAKEDLDRMSVSSSESHLSNLTENDSESEITEFDKMLCNEESVPEVKYRKKDRSYFQLDVNHHHIWSKNVEVTEQIFHYDETSLEKCSQLSALNLAHNLFTSIPVVLPCLAVNLTRLNMAFNTLRSMSHITSYPSSLKQLDLSHNQITVWPSLPQVEAHDNMELANLACYMDNVAFKGKSAEVGVRRHSSRSVRHTVLHSVCVHRRHLRLDNLRTLILADNQFYRIQLSTDDNGDISGTDDDEPERNPQTIKARLMFPNLSMLDMSNNNIREIPINIYELTNLSVLNISGNLGITELPPQMGLLSRLWNLNTRGCSLQDPLKFMIESKKYKTMDIIGYLKSVLEDAKPYARMKLMIVGVQGIGKTSLLDQLRQEGSTKKRPDHWGKRMGNKNINTKTSRGTNMSTVGVDIGDWVYEKKIRNQSVHGPVIFRTWDFGGQKEYYATHQYFLSKRSLYLVVWKISDGHRGINEILQWLVNIQARAPNSPVIIVGTHYDVVQEFSPNISEEYQQMIRDRFINIVDAEKMGLPRVLDTIEISCKTRHNVKLLCNLIYDTVFSLRPPGSKELLLEQKVPATYLALEDIVTSVAAEKRVNGLDPVLTSDQYKSIMTLEMQQRYNKSFRDSAELHQATLFLHENGVLLHYDDATLKDLYFLDPQWLCDMLAHVVTIREINPFARTGVMKLDDLKHVFKASNIGPIDTRGYVVNLLNKFEVALTWDSRTLLIPSLLPSEEDMIVAQMYPGQAGHPLVKVKVPLRSRGWAVRSKKLTVSPKSVLYNADCSKGFQLTMAAKASSKIVEQEELIQYEVTSRHTGQSITRLLLMSYFPSGFWSRLISRILADDSIIDIIRSFFILPKEAAQDVQLAKCLDLNAEWVLWQTGLQLKYGDITLFRLKEVLHNTAAHYRQLKFKIKQDSVWCDVDLQNSSILEIQFPVDSLIVKPKPSEHSAISQCIVKDELILECTKESTAQLLALAVDHIDILLEDWYPTLGTRFVHTSEGKFLITRLVPCPECMDQAPYDLDNFDTSHPSTSQVQDVLRVEVDQSRNYSRDMHRIRKSQESSTSEGDSGVDPDSSVSSRNVSMEGHPNLHQDEILKSPINYSWLVEECILASYNDRFLTCPSHGQIKLARIAPDAMFLDLGEKYIIKPESIKKGKLLGRGAFGFVFKGACKVRGSNNVIDVAMKMLQPVQPGPNARQSAVLAYKVAQGKWDRDPLQYACKAYCTARQELNILLSLRHPNIVPFVGVCTSPLALVLDLAPQGALDIVLRHYRRSGAKVGPYTTQAVILQVAKAVEYLHRQHIIYRDLKSENILVWDMPPPFIDHPDYSVHIKVADYGISRLTLPSGTKGFGGTEGFMAPEIMRYNGEEEYTEKVDCFSFGMFIYELLTLHQPFEGHESVKECILEGGRPPLTYRETLYPSYFLDLMVLCWSQQPKDRPTASQIVSIASAPEFTHLCDVVSLKHPASVVASTSAALTYITDDGLSGSEMWLMCENSRIDLLLAADRGWLQYHTMTLPIRPSATCTVGDTVWIGDCSGSIHAYSCSDGRKLFYYALETEPDSQVQSLVYLAPFKRVACALSNGRLFLVDSEIRPMTPTAAEGTFVMTELGLTSGINCMCSIFREGERVCELWCGGANGQITIYTIKDQVVASHEVLNHYQPVIDLVDVINLVSTENMVWSYVRPGCVVYQWDVKTRSIANKLDCSKLVPCSESLKSIAIEEHLSPTNCQVSTLVVLNDEIYIGTTWGCVIIAEKSTLRPITIFRPYEEEVKLIVPLAVPKSINESHENTPLIATMGRGYRSLLSRYTDVPFPVGTPLASPMPTSYTTYLNKPNMFILLWKAEHWNAV